VPHFVGCAAALASGASCTPSVSEHVCLQGSAPTFSCPALNDQPGAFATWVGSFPKQVCQICGVSVQVIDEDLRQGYFRASISFGPATFRGAVDETYVTEYRVYVVDVDGVQLGGPVAVVPKEEHSVVGGCCSITAYTALVELSLSGEFAAYDRLMIFLVVDDFELPAGVEVVQIKDQSLSAQHLAHENVLQACLTFATNDSLIFRSHSAMSAAQVAIATAAGVPLACVNFTVETSTELCGDAVDGNVRMLQEVAATNSSLDVILVLLYTIEVPEGAYATIVAESLRSKGPVSLAADILVEVEKAGPNISLEILAGASPVLVTREVPPPPLQLDCDDFPMEWSSKTGKTCSEYVSFGWCEPNGTYGLSWDFTSGIFGDFADEDGFAANEACCGCGGGRRIGHIVDVNLYAITTGSQCAESLPYAYLASNLTSDRNATLNTGVGDTPHIRWIQEIHPTGVEGSPEDMRIEWRFRSTKTLRERFEYAARYGESVRWLISWRGGVWEKSGTWFFSSAMSSTMSYKWDQEVTDSGGFSAEGGAWGAASGVIDGNGNKPLDFIGVGNFHVTDSSCGIVCFPFGLDRNDCQQWSAVRSLMSTVVEPGTCEGFLCSAGSKLMAAGWLPEYCKDSECTEDECCATLGTCATVDCSSYGERSGEPMYIPIINPPSSCANETCVWTECCEEAPWVAEVSGGAASAEIAVIAIIALLICLCVIFVVRNRDYVKSRLYDFGLLVDAKPAGLQPGGSRDAFHSITPHQVETSHAAKETPQCFALFVRYCCCLCVPRRTQVQAYSDVMRRDLEAFPDDGASSPRPTEHGGCSGQKAQEEETPRPAPQAPSLMRKSDDSEVPAPPLPPPVILPHAHSPTHSLTPCNRENGAPPLAGDGCIYLQQAGHRSSQSGHADKKNMPSAGLDLEVGGAFLDDAGSTLQTEEETTGKRSSLQASCEE